MNREIKFRVWDTKCMIEWNFLKHNSDLGLILANDTLYIPLQYTGLKDKNGVEIYEGDIVRINYFRMGLGQSLGVFEAEETLVGVIAMECFSWVLKNIVGEKWKSYTGYENGEGSCPIVCLHDVYEDSSEAEYQIEVIGNIYENPELLK